MLRIQKISTTKYKNEYRNWPKAKLQLNKSWNEQVIRQVFSDDIANKILHTSLISQVEEDKIIWKAERHRRYFV